ncbi:hypothetical protein K501DRAFT_285700 [Backusella circina FSU 941]|nr:hypothetical protein K501DRAFT_285700 [Backusella circina FSU 941]
MAPTLLSTKSYFSEYHNSNKNSWEQILSHFESQPDIQRLIQSCRIEEKKRHYEEARTKLKQYQVYYQIENMQTKELFSEKVPERHLSLRLPPLSH